MNVDQVNEVLSELGLRRKAVAVQVEDSVFIEWDSSQPYTHGGFLRVSEEVQAILERRDRRALLDLMRPRRPSPSMFEPWV